MDPLEGIWEAMGSNYRVAFLRDTARGGTLRFNGLILRADSVWWMPGQVKAALTREGERYRGTFYMRDHSSNPTTATVERGVFRGSNGIMYVREFPGPPGVNPEAFRHSLNLAIGLERLGPNTLLLHLPSFNDRFARAVDSVISANRTELARTENLIIDLRGNGGGSDFVYGPILPWLYTDTIVDINSNLYATEDNIAKFVSLSGDTTFPAGQRAEFATLVSRMRAVQGGWLVRDDSRMGFDRVLPYPRRVALVVDRWCGSSCEQFVLAAKQSRKVTVYGDNTAGVLDYANQWSLTSPCGNWRLAYPTSRSNRLPQQPVDPHGIAPDVRIPVEEMMPVAWVYQRLAGE
jgi:Peptidase family S41